MGEFKGLKKKEIAQRVSDFGDPASFSQALAAEADAFDRMSHVRVKSRSETAEDMALECVLGLALTCIQLKALFWRSTQDSPSAYTFPNCTIMGVQQAENARHSMYQALTCDVVKQAQAQNIQHSHSLKSWSLGLNIDVAADSSGLALRQQGDSSRSSIWVLHSCRPYTLPSQRSQDTAARQPSCRQSRFLSASWMEGLSRAGVPSKWGHALSAATDIGLEGG
ncbi:hypothetical protein NQZ68_005708 [Dissostichus eleginoides]|nr:hypothetical protein NQZ68_005708 [Dissostichus eleginoides]